MPNYQNAVVCGHLGRDPESRDVGGRMVCNLNVAVSSKKKGEEKTNWYRVDIWGKQAEACAKYLTKGRAVLVSGELDLREYTDKDGKQRSSLEIHANNVVFLGKGGDAGSETETPAEETPF